MSNETPMKLLSQDQFKPAVVLAYVLVAATLWKYTSIPVSDFADGWPLSFVLGQYKPIAALVLFGLVPMGIVRFVFRERLADYGLRPGIVKLTVRSFLLTAPPIVLIAVRTGCDPAFFDVYPFNEALRPSNADIGCGVFAIHAVTYAGYYFGWEFLFRGFLQHGLSERCGLPTAILVQTLASTMLHYGHPGVEVAASIVAGLFWGFLAVRTRSILSGWAQHTLLGVVLDATLIFTRTPV